MSGGEPTGSLKRICSWRSFANASIAVAATAVMMFAIPNAAAAFKYLKTGMEVPDFTLNTVEGKEIALSELKGAPATVIVFWSTWSPRSRPALEDLQKLQEEYGAKGFRALAINVNGMQIGHPERQEIKKMQEELTLGMPVAIDQGLTTYSSFGVVATPSTAVLDPEGKIVFEAASYLRMTGADIREQVEVLLGVREPAAEAVAEVETYKPARKALLNYNLGRNLLRLGSREKAIGKLEASVEADEKYAAPRILLGHLLLGEHSEESLARSEALFRPAVENEPENVSALTGLGEVLLEQGNLEEAATFLAKAIELDPAYTPAVSNMALLLARQGKKEESEKHFKEALELNPLDSGTYYRRGESLEALGNMGGAAADYRRAIEILLDLPPGDDEA